MKKNITMSVCIQPREPGPLRPEERKILADFFLALMDLKPKEEDGKQLFQIK